MSRNRKEKKERAVPVGIGILVFILAFGVGVVSKFAIQPSWAKEYSVKWNLAEITADIINDIEGFVPSSKLMAE